MKKAILSLSGGLDSCTTLVWLLNQGYSVLCIFFEYGSKHNRWENVKAVDFFLHYARLFPPPQLDLRTVDLSATFASFKSDLLTSGGAIPEGHYAAENMKATVVPARNMIFLSVLAGLAESENIDNIALGIHQGDHEIYPDCRPSFFTAMGEAIQEGTSNSVSLLAPFLTKNKIDIVRYGNEFNLPFYKTRTCYKDQPLACGKCGSCVERLDAFNKNGLIDPVHYE